MPTDLHKAQAAKSWEILKYSRKLLGMPLLQSIFGNRSTSLITRWGQNPEYSEHANRNPIDQVQALAGALVEDGREDLARAIITIISEQIPSGTEPSKEPAYAVHFGVQQAVLLLGEVAKEKAHPNLIRQRGDDAVRKIQEFIETYREAYSKGGAEAVRFSVVAEQDTPFVS